MRLGNWSSVLVLVCALNLAKAQDVVFPDSGNSNRFKERSKPEETTTTEATTTTEQTTTTEESAEETTTVDEVPDCKVVSGPAAGSECVFPFTFNNETFDKCITISDPEGEPWCPTKVNDDGEFISGGGFWGYCAVGCPVTGLDVTSTSTSGSGESSESGQIVRDEYEACKTPDGLSGTCEPVSICIGLNPDIEEHNVCRPKGTSEEDEVSFVCCPDVVENIIPEQFAINNSRGDKDDIEAPEGITAEEIEQRFIFRPPLDSPDIGNREEDDLGILQDIDEGEQTPEQFHLLFNQPRSSVFSVDAAASSLLQLTNDVTNENELSDDDVFGLRLFDSDTIPTINENCPWTPTPICNSEDHFQYRTLDGRCNNFDEPNYGRAATPFQRILDPEYDNGTVQMPRVSDNDGVNLPSPRLLSMKLTRTLKGDEEDSNEVLDKAQTVLIMQMGQFIDHDLTHTPNHGIECCNKDGSFPDSYDADMCYPLEIPEDDEFWGGRKTCMSMARSLAAPGLKCELEFRQQMNQITHWLDGSNIYGSSEEESNHLREAFGGQLKVTRRAGTIHGSLPLCKRNSAREVETCHSCKSCFFAGDGRANEQLNLLVMHTIWVREHNRVARALRKRHPDWDNDTLFHEARRIVIAEYQHIIFKEWLPAVIGNEYMTSFGLWPLSKGFSPDYMDNFDPRVTNEFATAAFRFGHSLIPTAFHRVSLSRQGRGIEPQVSEKMRIKEMFFTPKKLQGGVSMMDEMVRGMVNQRGHLWDNTFSEDIINHLFETERTKDIGGLDLVAMNVQRGRDHGIPGYNNYREVCGLGRAREWSDLKDYISEANIEKLKKAYRSIEDVDLFIGGILERQHRDAVIGPTFKCIIGDTFAKLKLGDRFFYDLGPNVTGNSEKVAQTRRFTQEQLQEIRRASMARVICDNTDFVKLVQPRVFQMPNSSRTNGEVSCFSFALPSINLDLF